MIRGLFSGTPDCSPTSFCRWVFDQTHNTWLAQSSDWLLVKPAKILGIILIALFIRWLMNRLIKKLTESTAEGLPSILRPLRERAPGAFVHAGLIVERRKQRAQTIGSLLRSVTGAVVFSIAGMMILAEIGVNLAPLLASAGVVGVALGFGAQTIVKDLLSGIFMLLEDQYGVGDNVDVGTVSGAVEAVGLRVTTIRDGRGVLWYVRNGEIVRVGNQSQGWAAIIIDVPVGFTGVDPATQVIRDAVAEYSDDPDHEEDFIEKPEVLGVEQFTAEGAVLRVTAKTPPEAQWRVGRELRRRVADSLDKAGISSKIGASRLYLRPPGTGETGATGAK